MIVIYIDNKIPLFIIYLITVHFLCDKSMLNNQNLTHYDIWRLSSLSVLTPMVSNMGLTRRSLYEAILYIESNFKSN